MNKLLQVLLNVLTLGIPLIVRVLCEAKQFREIVNKQVDVKIIDGNGSVNVELGVGRVKIELAVDEWISR